MTRRRNDRYGVTNAMGVLRVPRDVTVQQGVCGEFVAISDKAAAIGEPLTLERIVDGTLATVQVDVIDSRPIVVRGSLRHRLLLRQNDEGAHEAQEIRRPQPTESRNR